MKKLIILSDIWGKRKSDWINYYVTILENHFEVVFYDCCELAKIDLSEYFEDSIHQQFTNGGVKIAVKALLDKEKKIVNVLGFSIGGFIAWKAILDGLNVESLTAISSTRLRYEDKRPDCVINLFYAENDKYKPIDNWFRELNIEINIYKEEEHEFYSNKKTAIDVCKKIIEQTKPNR
ncbi:alpha/beta hydrolase [Flavobacterium sp. XS1P32]|uniref:alpha/beta hydrolase n=1 Tax=Flavobacterium sp. XS1P32 TaxID=3401726 RepID=UPI003AAC36F6